jgi:hypothetical protein
MELEAENDLEKYLILRQEVVLNLLRALAFSFMEKLGVAHRIKRTQKMAGWHSTGLPSATRGVAHK